MLLVGVAVQDTVLSGLRGFWIDACHYLSPRTRQSAPAIIVEIDEPSLARHGQWPWPRTLLAQLVDRIAASRPAAIGLDFVLPEADRLSPERLRETLAGMDAELAERLARLKRNDAVLAEAVARAPVVLGVAGMPDRDPLAPRLGRRTPVHQRGGDAARFVLPYLAAVRSIDELQAAAAGHGLLNPDPRERVVRRIPLVAAIDGALVPTLAIDLLRVAAGERLVRIHVGRRGVRAVEVGDLAVPTQPDGTVFLHYGPHDERRFVSAASLLRDAVPRDQLEGKLVLVGVTALRGTTHPTPVASAMSGVEIHAQLLENLFDGSLLRRPRWTAWAEAIFLAGAGLLLVLVVPGLAVRRATVMALPVVVAPLAVGFVAYRWLGVVLDAVAAALGLAVLFAVVLGTTLADAQRQRRILRRQLERERESAARLAGELEAARRIQMGLLPAPDRVFPGETRFALHAFLEPARVVGGDLYDFFSLDEHRVFVLIGDVSGKGLPGSLFMALTKTLVKSIALRGGPVAAVMAAANAEMSRENPEEFFVTACACILDARTGGLEFCNAGHEPPYLLPGAGGGPIRLLGGGPALCFLDDFDYQAETRALAPGDTLCLVTDGVIEAMNQRGELYGRPRLEAVLARVAPALTVEETLRAIQEDVAAFAAGAESTDDIAIVVLRWRGTGGSVGISAP